MDKIIDFMKRLVLAIITCVAAALIGYVVFGLVVSEAMDLPGLGQPLFIGGMTAAVFYSFSHFFSRPVDPEEEKRKQEEMEKRILEYLNKDKKQ